jgi:hypothetical protein
MTTEEKPKASKLRATPPSFSTFIDDCSRPACDDMTSMMKQAQERSSHTAANTGTAVAASQTPSVECPPNSAFLGRSSWTLLHSMVRIGLPFVSTKQVTQNPTNHHQFVVCRLNLPYIYTGCLVSRPTQRPR